MSGQGLRFPGNSKPDKFTAPRRGSSINLSAAPTSRAPRFGTIGLHRAVGRRAALTAILRGAIGFGMARSLAPTFVFVTGAGAAPRGHLAWVWQFTEDGPP